jgi:outer membrane protein OmpA-like peptidoglycan-associated protein
MRNTIAATTLTISTLLGSGSVAALETEMKQDLTALGTIAVATAAAGPIGFLAGALGGSWLAAQVAEADKQAGTEATLAQTEQQLDDRQRALAALQRELNALRVEQTQLANSALEQLQLEMLFTSGDASLTESGLQRVHLLAAFLARNPDLSITIEGFADPRGDEESNLRLSRARAGAVAEALTVAGIPQSRMTLVAHGDTQSRAPVGDVDAYALERRVRIELSRAESDRQVAEVTINESL